MSKTPHIHKLKRHRFKTGSEVYFCVLDCPLKLSISLALGKKTLCWRCGEAFIMTEYSIRLAKPHCDACHMPKIKHSQIEIINDTELNELIEAHKEPLTLAERLTKTINEASKQTEEDI